MEQLTDSTTIQTITTPRISETRRIFRVMFSRWVVVFGTVIVVVLILTAIFAPFISPYDPYEQNMKAVLDPPSKAHLLGTDELGRDLLSRIIYGSRISLLVGIVAVGIAAAIGMGFGLISGFFGRWVDVIIMRFIDAFMALPPLVLMLAISAVLGAGLRNILISIGITMMPAYARLMRGQVMTVKENDYITAARSLGANDYRIMFSHIVPNCFPPLLVLMTLNLGIAIIMEASLSFIGIGIPQPTPSWGAMVSVGYKYLITNPLFSMSPGIAILLVVLGFNMVGDGLRDALDPRLRGLY
jgi:peptide/nickel transport system permease protein